MRVIARRTLNQYAATLIGHKDQIAVKQALDAWFDEARKRSLTLGLIRRLRDELGISADVLIGR